MVFLIQVISSKFGILFGTDNLETISFLYKWGFIPRELSEGIQYSDFRTPSGNIDIESPIPTFMTLITSMFLHGGGTHFVGNILFLWVFGDNVEHRLGISRYLGLYFVTGIAASFAHYWTDTGSGTVLVGASGAISGVMGAYILIFPTNRVRVLFMFVFITVVEVRALYILGLWFLWQAFQGLVHIGVSSTIEVAFMAHVGGFVGGLIYASIFTTVLTNRR